MACALMRWRRCLLKVSFGTSTASCTYGMASPSASCRGGGQLPVPFALGDGVRAASQICYEVGFPEGSRRAALAGANVLTYSAAFGAARVSVWDVAVRARAIENGCYVIAADLWGCEDEHPPFAGHSCIVAPSGEVISRVDEGEGLAIADINLAEVDDFRGKVPYLRDLRRDVVARAWRDLDRG